jgi:hypothetical protein
MVYLDYNDYIQSPEWKKKNKYFIDYFGKCRRCGSTERLGSHHTSYKNLGNESFLDVEVLCWSCHHNIDGGRIHKPLEITQKEYNKMWEKESRWREVEKTLPWYKPKEEIKIEPKTKFNIKLKEPIRITHYEKGKFVTKYNIPFLIKIEKVLKNMVSSWNKFFKKKTGRRGDIRILV